MTKTLNIEDFLNYDLRRAQAESEHEDLERPACPGCTQPMEIEEGAWWCCECEILGEEVN